MHRHLNTTSVRNAERIADEQCNPMIRLSAKIESR